jgi:hypothetical protein
VSKLSGHELFEEIVWLLDGGMSPVYICEQLNTNVKNVIAMAERRGNSKVAKKFREELAYQRKQDYDNRETI